MEFIVQATPHNCCMLPKNPTYLYGGYLPKPNSCHRNPSFYYIDRSLPLVTVSIVVPFFGQPIFVARILYYPMPHASMDVIFESLKSPPWKHRLRLTKQSVVSIAVPVGGYLVES